MIHIVPISEEHADSFHQCLDAVAREERYLGRTEAPPHEQTLVFVKDSVAKDAAQFVAIDDGRVVGWADIFPHTESTMSHCGSLGIGVLPRYRGQGLGKRLLDACISKARSKGITRIELEVRADNNRAIRLYESRGFQYEARKRQAMCFGGVYYDTVQMRLLAHED